MPDYRNPLTPINPQFSPVRAIDRSGRGDVLGKALSDVVTGAAVFGKAAAQEKGQKIALEQTGATLDPVQAADEVQQLINKELGGEMDRLAGPLSKDQIRSSYEKAARNVSLTDKHLQSLVDAGVISSTEAKARSRMNLQRRINEGSNFLFQNELIDAAYNTTGGSRGRAIETEFPKTAAEIQAETQQKGQLEALQKYEEKLTEIQLTTGVSRDAAAAEVKQYALDERRAKELEGQGALNAATLAESLDIIQANSSRTLEMQMSKSLDEKGLLDPMTSRVLKSQVAQYGMTQREKLANTTGINTTEREKREKDIIAWENAMNSRFDILDKNQYNKEDAESIKLIQEMHGVAAVPYATLLKDHPELLKALSVRPSAEHEQFLKTYLGETEAKDLMARARMIRNQANVFLKGNIDNFDDIAILQAEPTKNAAMLEDPAFKSKLKQIYDKAPRTTAASFRSEENIHRTMRQKDPTIRSNVIAFYDFQQKDLLHTLNKLDAGGIKLSSNLTDLQGKVVTSVEYRNVLGFKEKPKVFIDVPQEIVNVYPQIVTTVSELYKTFEKHTYLWSDKYKNSIEGFNAYISGELEISPSTFDAKGNYIGRQEQEAEKKTIETKVEAPAIDDHAARVKEFENKPQVGFEGGVWKPHASLEGGTDTIGYGHKLSKEEAEGQYVLIRDEKVSTKDGLTPEQVDALFEQDWEQAGLHTDRLLVQKDLKDIPVKAKNILQEMVYQMGYSGVKGFNTMINHMKKGNYDKAADSMLKSKWAKEDSPERARVLADDLRNLGGTNAKEG
jgi:GH24 family phage-related lysozyme (muramidase)